MEGEPVRKARARKTQNLDRRWLDRWAGGGGATPRAASSQQQQQALN
jgi:hypothetical protein